MVPSMREAQEIQVMEAIVQADLDRRRFRTERDLADHLGWELPKTVRVLSSLIEGGYVAAVDAGSEEPPERWTDLRPTGKPRPQVEQWPALDPWDRLIKTLQESIDAEQDPTRQDKLVGVRDAILHAGRDVVINALGDILVEATGDP